MTPGRAIQSELAANFRTEPTLSARRQAIVNAILNEITEALPRGDRSSSGLSASSRTASPQAQSAHRNQSRVTESVPIFKTGKEMPEHLNQAPPMTGFGAGRNQRDNNAPLPHHFHSHSIW